MPLYEYYCPKCQSKYEVLRSMSRSDDSATCPKGHVGGARTLSMFASVSRGAGGGCGCGGGGCSCGH